MVMRSVACLSLAVVLAACGGVEDVPAADSPAAEAAAAEPAATPMSDLAAPCGAMTIDDAAEILGADAGGIEHGYSEELETCTFRAGVMNDINYVVYFEADESTALSELSESVSGISFISECRDVEGPGIATVYCNSDQAERLLVVSGNVFVDVLSPSGQENMIRVAERVLGE